MHGENGQVHRIAALGGGGQRRVKNPAHARARPKARGQVAIAARCQHRGHTQRHTGHEHPVAQVVHPRESHVRRTDLQRHEVVAETAEQRRDHHEEHHQDAVIGDHHVPKVAVRGASVGRGDETRTFLTHVLHTGVHQLHPHVEREDDRNQPDKTPGKEI